MTHGYTRRRDVPADGGRPKVCPRCKLWFSQQSRERLCTACRPRQAATRLAVRRGQVKSASPQVKVDRKSLRGMSREALEQEALTYVSEGCRKPTQQQAELLPCDMGRRHPYGGDRPAFSGYCVERCNCSCHVKAYQAAAAA